MRRYLILMVAAMAAAAAFVFAQDTCKSAEFYESLS